MGGAYRLAVAAAVGAVAVPATGRVYTTAEACSRAIVCGAPPRMVVSRTRATDMVERVGVALATTRVGMGSAGVKAMAVVDGRADIYLHDGGNMSGTIARPPRWRWRRGCTPRGSTAARWSIIARTRCCPTC